MTSDDAVVFVNRTLGSAYVGERLAGGFFDHVLRVRRRDSPSSVIVKRVESFAQAMHERERPLRRLARETRVLHLFDRNGPLHSLHGRVRTPRVHWAELRTRTVVFENVGRCPSLETMFELPLEPVGRFVGLLHTASAQRKVGWLRRLFAKPQLGSSALPHTCSSWAGATRGRGNPRKPWGASALTSGWRGGLRRRQHAPRRFAGPGPRS